MGPAAIARPDDLRRRALAIAQRNSALRLPLAGERAGADPLVDVHLELGEDGLALGHHDDVGWRSRQNEVVAHDAPTRCPICSTCEMWPMRDGFRRTAE